MSGKLYSSNNTGGALNIDVGIVEQTDVIQLDALATNQAHLITMVHFHFNGQSTGYTTSIVVDYGSLTGTFPSR